jgi:hypothetical protein
MVKAATTKTSTARQAWMVLTLAALPALAGAATPAPRKAHSSHKAKAAHPAAHESERPELFGGYSHAHSGDAGLGGFELSGSLPFRDRVQLEADLGRHSGSFGPADLRQTSLMAGLGTTWPEGDLRPFARALVGVVRSKTEAAGLSESGTHAALSVGGGLAYLLSEHWGARVQLDLVFVHGDGWETDPRYAIGAVYRFGN